MVKVFVQDIGSVEMAASAAVRLRNIGHNSFDIGRTKCVIPIGHNITVEKYLDEDAVVKLKGYLKKMEGN